MNKKMKIINVFKTHFDIGFTDLTSNVVLKYGNKMLTDVLNACESSENRPEGKRFVWTMAAWPLIKALEICSPSEKIRAQHFISNGQLIIHALPYTFHTESLGVGDMQHIFDAADEFCAKYGGKMPISAKMTDVPGHTIALVKYLAKKGVKFLHLGCNPASMYPKVPLMFWWEDREGNRVLTFYNNTYGSTVIPPKGWKYPVWLSMQQSNDNLGPQDVSILDNIEKEVNEKIPSAECIFGSMDDFYKEIIKCDLSDLPVVKEDLGDTWIHGVGTYPKEVSLLRRARNIVKDIDLPKDEEYKFYDNSLLFSEHTWGMDVKTFLTWQRSYPKEIFVAERNLPRYKLIEESWDEQRERARVCGEIASKYGELYPNFKLGVLETDKIKIGLENNIPVIINKITGRKLTVEYKYQIIGTQSTVDFMRKYLTRFYGWALSDFGRESYGEVEGKKFKSIFVTSKKDEGCLEVLYNTNKESFVEYGNATGISMKLSIVDGKVHLRVNLNKKVASPYIETGNLVISSNSKGEKYAVKKIDYELDASHDIRKDANQKLYCVSDKVQIDDVTINPIDSPLVSFGDNAIYEFNGGLFKKPKKVAFVFNLFNNMWGTNFPQWIEGDFVYDYIIEI